MRKLRRWPLALVIFGLVLTLSGCALLVSCDNEPDGLQTLCDGSGLDLSAAQFLSDDDSHGGFHGDGVRLAVIRFDAPVDTAALAAADGWSVLPFRSDLAQLLYEGMEGVWPSATRIPEIGNGYWYFLDRCSAQSSDFGRPFIERAAYNFTTALYDADTQTLYYCEADT